MLIITGILQPLGPYFASVSVRLSCMKKIVILYCLSLLPVALDAAPCKNLLFLPVKPKGHYESSQECNPAVDRIQCLYQKGMEQFGRKKIGQSEVLTLELDIPSQEVRNTYLQPLELSPLIVHVNQLKIKARTIAQSPRVCESNLVYVGSHPLFGMGPAFHDGYRFEVSSPEGHAVSLPYSNLLLLENAQLIDSGFFSPNKSSSFTALQLPLLNIGTLRNEGYYDVVVAHELVHGLMQDLYGVDEMKKLVHDGVISRTGHFSSAITDPTLAWVEGFAEGFEAYLGEKFQIPMQMTHMDEAFQRLQSRIELMNYDAFLSYLSIPSFVSETFSMLQDISGFISDFLKSERQVSIRENRYIFKGQFVNLYHAYDVVPQGLQESESIENYEVESTQTIYSKEGAVAHLIYRMLKLGLFDELCKIISQEKPRNIYDFVRSIPQYLSQDKSNILQSTINSLFHDKGRELTKQFMLYLSPNLSPKYNDVYLFLDKKLADLSPQELSPPVELWIEYLNATPTHIMSYGLMDRLNLMTAPADKLHSFLLQFIDSDRAREEVLTSLKSMQLHFGVENLLSELSSELFRLAQSNQFTGDIEVGDAYLETAHRLIQARQCFLNSPTCWADFPQASTLEQLYEALRENVRTGKVREKIFLDTKVGNKILDLWQDAENYISILNMVLFARSSQN